jgi:hypothetical protein
VDLLGFPRNALLPDSLHNPDRISEVRPTRSTLKAWWLKLWVVEGSLDGESWTEIDRQTNNQDFMTPGNIAVFALARPAEHLTSKSKFPFAL